MHPTHINGGRGLILGSLALAAMWPAAASAQIPITTLINPSFEIGTPGTAVNTGWSTAPGVGPMFLVDASIVPLMETIDPSAPFHGLQYLTGNRNAGGWPTSQAMGVVQDIDLSSWSTEIDGGGRGMELDFAYNDADGQDSGVVSFSFLDGGDNPVGSTYMFETDSSPTGGGAWATNTLTGAVPVSARTMRVTLLANPGAGGTLRNINYDAFGATLTPTAPADPISDRVNGNLVQFNSDGMWTWYSDERSVVDPNNGHVLIGSTASSGTTNRPPGAVDVVNYDPATGSRQRFQLSDIQEDDHNAPGLLVLPDGRYLALYSNHGNVFGLGDEFTRWRVTNNPADSTSWTSEQQFNWFTETPGVNPGQPDSANVSYHNLFYLSDEDKVYNFSRSFQQAPNILIYDEGANSLDWDGQLADSTAGGYSTGYFKYASNGVDRIYFTHTETHPRNFNTSIYSGYIEGGQTFDMDGTLLDSDISDNESTGGAGAVPDVTEFTPVQLADAPGTAGNFRLWTVDMALGDDGNPTAMYVSRFYDSGPGNGSDPNPIDHRLHYARWDGAQWHTFEIAQMGNRLYRGTDISEQDYTGNGALVPGDPNTVYISTTVDPRDPSGATTTQWYEIYKGVTADGGANWDWTAITEDSTVDNLRPIVPDPQGGDRTVIWFRGHYTTAQNVDAAVVGIIERDNETVGLVNYVDAVTSNTALAGGGAFSPTGPNGSQGATDNNWHERTGIGNGGSVFTANEMGSENAPMLRTTLSGLADGTYDIFAYFWSDIDEDWRLQAGLDSGNLVDFRHHGSQFAESDQFIAIDVVSASSGELQLYRAYVGRTDVVGGSDIDVFIDDWQTSSNVNRTWYDGVGYALVGAGFILGDTDGDGDVDADDLMNVKDLFGEGGPGSLGDADGDGDTDIDDLVAVKNNYGFGVPPPGIDVIPEPASAALLLVGGMGLLMRRRRV